MKFVLSKCVIKMKEKSQVGPREKITLSVGQHKLIIRYKTFSLREEKDLHDVTKPNFG